LHRVVNSGGRVIREYASGLGRLDLLVEFADEHFAFELKLNHSNKLRNPKVLEAGKEQLLGYLNELSLDFGRLVVFRRYGPEYWDEVGLSECLTHKGKRIEVIWM